MPRVLPNPHRRKEPNPDLIPEDVVVLDAEDEDLLVAGRFYYADPRQVLPSPLEDGRILAYEPPKLPEYLKTLRIQCQAAVRRGSEIVQCEYWAHPGYYFCKKCLIPSVEEKPQRCIAIFAEDHEYAGEQCPMRATRGRNKCPKHGGGNLWKETVGLTHQESNSVYGAFIPISMKARLAAIIEGEAVKLESSDDEIRLSSAAVALATARKIRCPGTFKENGYSGHQVNMAKAFLETGLAADPGSPAGKACSEALSILKNCDHNLVFRCTHRWPGLESPDQAERVVKMNESVIRQKQMGQKLVQEKDAMPHEEFEKRMTYLADLMLSCVSSKSEREAIIGVVKQQQSGILAKRVGARGRSKAISSGKAPWQHAGPAPESSTPRSSEPLDVQGAPADSESPPPDP